ncbi:hypothetical protein D3C84_121210 [compost metagenome]
MFYRIAADGLMLMHLLFIAFVLLGALLAFKWRQVIWCHLPAAVWGILVEIFHWNCPLTHWENLMRHDAGQAGYSESFIEHYVWPLIYPTGLTPNMQLGLGALVLLVNLIIYALLIRRWRQA